MTYFSLTVNKNGKKTVINADSEKSILESLSAHGNAPDAPCGGRGTCGKCTVRVKGLLRSIESGETVMTDNTVCACRYMAAGDCELWLEESRNLKIAAGENEKIAGGYEGLGLAVDIGTTTIVSALYDLKTGELIEEKREMNAQRAFGADVVTRMERCRRGDTEKLVSCLEEQLSGLYPDKQNIKKLSIVGNTVMEHFALGLDPADIAVPPFTPKSLFGEHVKHKLWENADAYVCRCISSYVGGDVPAGMLASGLLSKKETCLYVDIGTNGEIAIGNADGYVTCATAAGPAFEGAEIECGMTASIGAIDAVYAENGEVRLHVIGEGKAVGICGSGLIDAAAVMLELGIIGKSGRFTSNADFAGQIREIKGAKAFMLTENVYVSIRDIRKLQLAKAAIRAGIELLMQGVQVSEIIVAGSFGKYMNTESAVKIGLLPEIENCRITQVGNAAAYGAALLLNPGTEEKLNALADKCSYVDLSSSKEFSESYIKHLNF